MKQSVYLSDTEHARWKALGLSLGDVVRAGLSVKESEQATAAHPMTCVTCGEPVRHPQPGDGLDRDYEWTHASGNPICDGPPTAWPRAQEGTQR